MDDIFRRNYKQGVKLEKAQRSGEQAAPVNTKYPIESITRKT
jgi:hypothetical protein